MKSVCLFIFVMYFPIYCGVRHWRWAAELNRDDVWFFVVHLRNILVLKVYINKKNIITHKNAVHFLFMFRSSLFSLRTCINILIELGAWHQFMYHQEDAMFYIIEFKYSRELNPLTGEAIYILYVIPGQLTWSRAKWLK
jgi:hypothetical protein